MSMIRSAARPSFPWILLGAFIASAIPVKLAQDRVDGRSNPAARGTDVLYFGSPVLLKKMALGYDSLVADLYWMRAIQYYGRREEAARRPVRYGNLAAILDITTTLDPRLLDAYRFGGSFLAEPDPIGAGQPHEAIKLLDKGSALFPQEWRLLFDKGFVYFWQLRDYKKAGEVWLAASMLSSSPEWMGSLAAMGLSKSGAVETARILWERQLQDSTRSDVKENARNHLLTMRMDEERWTLEFIVERYRVRVGARPRDLDQLLRAGFLKFVPKDPSGVPYVYDSSTGEVRVSPETKTRYLKKKPYDYRTAFMDKLAR